MKLCAYIVTYDGGSAPNPFWRYCTLAFCTPHRKRAKLEVGDWIVGLLDKSRGNKLLYAMEISEVLDFDEYFNDKRFAKKKFKVKGNWQEECGDNIYRRNSEGELEPYPHSYNHPRNKNQQDLDMKYPNVFISEKDNFYYFGRNAKDIPSKYNIFAGYNITQNIKYFDPPIINDFILWLKNNHKPGIHGDPNNKRKAILVRVGIDGTKDSGRWNAPCNPDTKNFVYVPIQQTEKSNAPGMERYYSKLIVPALDSFSKCNNRSISLPKHLMEKRMHLDPDFENLTYGDTSSRGKKLLDFKEDDLVVFYASLKPIKKTKDNFVYALIGMLVVKEILRVKDVDPKRFDENAHTRNAECDPTDIVVIGKEGVSGRFEKCIPIGERRNNAYRVEERILGEWGEKGLEVKDGYIQRSANPPLFEKPERFYEWLKKKNPKLIQTNNP